MTLPKENLDNKTYEDLVKEAVSRIPVYAPEWTDHNVHDPGRTFIELFAWLAEMQIYNLNRITDRSRRKFLKLMGIPELRPAKAATVDVTFSILNGTSPSVKKGTIVAASDPVTGEDILFETQQDIGVVDAELTKILVHPNEQDNKDFIDRSDANKNENVYYYAFRSRPEEDDELYLGFDKDPGEEFILLFYLFKDGLAERGIENQLFPSGKVRWEYWNASDSVSEWKSVQELADQTNHLSTSGKIRIKKGPMSEKEIEGNNLHWLRCVVEDGKYDIPPKIDQIRLNTVDVVQRSRVKQEQFSCSGLPDFSFNIKHIPVLDYRQDDGTPKITVDNDEWIKVEDFDASTPGNTHYTMDLKSGRVTFGDGVHGKIPPEGENNIRVSYRTGGGVRGNVKAGAINRVEGDPGTKVSVTNHRPARGGEEAETLEEAIQRARVDLKTPYRAVTSQDYELLARNTPGVRVARAKALPGYYPGKDSPVPGIVSVIVVPQVSDENVNPEPSQGFLRTVYMHLDKRRLLTTELYVMRPDYKEITVKATVRIHQRFVEGSIKEDVIKKLNDFLHLTKGGPDGTGWPFGRSVYRSEIYEVIDRVEGVNHIEDVSLEINGMYLFSWDNIPGNDNRRLIDFMKQNYGIDCVETAKIEKIDDGKTIILSTEKNSIYLKLNDNTNVSLEIDGIRTGEFNAKMENSKLNIYNGILSKDDRKKDIAIPPHSLVYSGNHLITVKEIEVNELKEAMDA